MKSRSCKNFYCFLQDFVDTVNGGVVYDIPDQILSPMTYNNSRYPAEDLPTILSDSEYTPKIPLPYTSEYLYPFGYAVGLGSFLMDLQYVYLNGYSVKTIIVVDSTPRKYGYHQLNAKLEVKI